MSANPDGQYMPRAERHAQVVRMKNAGLTFKQIARTLGLGVSTVTSAYYDPTGEQERARKQKVSGTCKDCGVTTHNSGSKPGERCAACRHRLEKTPDFRLAHRSGSEKRWSDADIFAAIRSVARTDGRATAKEYDKARALNPAAMPSLPIIIKRFGKWAIAVRSAGCISTERGPYNGSITREGCWLAVEDCAAELGHPPTYSEYCAWARANDGPCGSTIRNKVGNWKFVTRTLLESEALVEAVAA